MIAVAIITIINLIAFIGLLTTDKNHKEKCGVVYFPKWFRLVGYITGFAGITVFGSGFILSLVLTDIFYNVIWYSELVIAAFILLAISIILECRNRRIEIGEDTFQYHTLFGRVYTFRYSGIIKTKRTNNTIYLFTERKLLFIDTKACDIDEFMAAVTRDQIKR